jgi:pyruvate dehydrogenase (quinone)
MFMRKTVADILVDFLLMGGVKRAYGVPGDSIDPFVETVRRSQSLKYIQVRHEEGGAFAASFDAKFNGNLAACFGTSGPGSIHLINGLYDAKTDKVPVIAITGQVSSDLYGEDYHQEVNLVKLFDDVAVFNKMVIDPLTAPNLISKAIREAKRLRGVSHLNFPVNILMKKVELPRIVNTEIVSGTIAYDMSAALKLINSSRHPVLLIGRGALSERESLETFSERIGAPIIYALLGKGIFSDDSKQVFGGLGLLGSRPSVEAINGSDLIIEIGSTFPYRKFIPRDIKMIQVDTDPGNLGNELPVDVPINSDAHHFLNSVINSVQEKESKYYLEFERSMNAWRNELRKIEERETRTTNPALLSRALSEYADKDAVIVTDTGNTTVWIARHFGASAGQRFLFSGALASMGCALPGAVGVSLSTGRQVISAVGDGGLAMTAMELSTVKKYNLPMKIVVFNNSKLAMIKYEQEVMGYPEWGVDLVNPDFSLLARAYEIDSLTIRDSKEIRNGVSTMLESKGPFLLEAITDPNLKPMPPFLTFEQAKGYLIASMREWIDYEPETDTSKQ